MPLKILLKEALEELAELGRIFPHRGPLLIWLRRQCGRATDD
jgi:hypothetical protein